MSSLVSSYKQYIGNSVESKPVPDQRDLSSTFYEIDTRDTYIWDGKEWHLFFQRNRGFIEDEIVSSIQQILNQLKIMNLHLYTITDEMLSDSEIY